MNRLNVKNKSILTIVALSVAIILLLFTMTATTYAAMHVVKKPPGDITSSVRGGNISEPVTIYDYNTTVTTDYFSSFYLTSPYVTGKPIAVSIRFNLELNPGLAHPSTGSLLGLILQRRRSPSEDAWTTIENTSKDGNYSFFDRNGYVTNLPTTTHYRLRIMLRHDVYYSVNTLLYKMTCTAG